MASKQKVPDPLWSKEAEESTLGAILLRPAVLSEVASIITAVDFYQQAHARIFRTIMELYLKNEPVDIVTVCMLLKDRGQLDKVGGPLFLSGLSEQVGIAANAGYHANIVKNKAILRRLLACSQKIAAECVSPQENLADFLLNVESQVFDITSSNGLKRGESPDLE